MADAAFTRASLDAAEGERFVSLRRALGISGLGMNQIILQAGQRGRIHAHTLQDEVYIVWKGVLTLAIDGVDHDLGPGEIAFVPPATRRQLINRGPATVELIALGVGLGEHVGRDGLAWESWEAGPPRAPQEVPLPDDLPAAERR